MRRIRAGSLTSQRTATLSSPHVTTIGSVGWAHHVVDRAHVGFLGDKDRPVVRLRVGVADPGYVPEQDVPGNVARDEEPTAGAERQAEHACTAVLEHGQRLEDFKSLAAVRLVAGHRGNGFLRELDNDGIGAGRRHDPVGAIGDGPWPSVRPPQARQRTAGRHVPADHRLVAPGRQQPCSGAFEARARTPPTWAVIGWSGRSPAPWSGRSRPRA